MKGIINLRSSMTCYGEDDPFHQFCNFKNVCYHNGTIHYFGKLRYDGEEPFIKEIYPGVGTRRRNDLDFVYLIENNDSMKFIQENMPCYTNKQSYIFGQTFNNYYFTIYTTFALHETLKKLRPKYPLADIKNNTQIFMTDVNHVRPLIPELYRLFTSSKIIKLSEVRANDISLCFDDVTVGLSKDAILGEEFWYQDNNEAFKRDWRSYLKAHESNIQTPTILSSSNTEFNVDRIKKYQISKRFLKFRDYILRKFNLYQIVPQTSFSGEKITISIISRSNKRRILNEKELINAIRKRWEPYVEINRFKMEDYSFKDQVHIMRNSSIVIGMHGAGMMNSMWLSEDSVVIELFPYKYYKPTFELICDLLHIKRYTWNNKDPNMSIFDWSRLDFDPDEIDKQELLKTTHHNKINNKKLRNFFKNQDTFVNIQEIMLILDPILKRMVFNFD